MSLHEVQLEHRPYESEEVQTDASLRGANPSVRSAEIFRVKRGEIARVQDAVAVEEPLEIQLVYGAVDDRKVKSISITMRTPGNDDELAAGFLMTEGVVRDATHIIIDRSSICSQNRAPPKN
jgi:FdhD protein